MGVVVKGRHPYLAVLAAGTALTLCACGGGSRDGSAGSSSDKPHRGGTLRVIGSGDVSHLDPLSSYHVPEIMLDRTFARTLVSYPASANPRRSLRVAPDVASELPSRANHGVSSDGKTYTFHLRGGVRWNTTPAREVTAQDFERTFKRMCNPVRPAGDIAYYTDTIKGLRKYCNAEKAHFAKAHKPSAQDIASFQNSHTISGVTAKDDKTLVVELNAPASDFLNLLSMPFAAPTPKEYDQYLPDSVQFRQHTISNGPYQIASYKPGASIALHRSHTWRSSSDPLRKAYVDRIEIREGYRSPEQVQRKLRTGAADLPWDLPFPESQLTKMKRDKNFHAYQSYTSNPYLLFNFASPNQRHATSKLEVRKAIEYAISKVSIGRLYGGTSLNKPIHGVIPPGVVGYEPFNLYRTPGDQGDPQRCKRLLASAGYKKRLTLKAAYRDAGNDPAVARSYAKDLKNCGITVKLVRVPQRKYYSSYLSDPKHAKSGGWDITAPDWLPDWPGNNGRTALPPLFSAASFPPYGSNYGMYHSARVDHLMDEALTAKTTSTAGGYWHRADEQIMKDAAVVPFEEQKIPLYHSPRVHGAIFMPKTQLFDLSSVWL